MIVKSLKRLKSLMTKSAVVQIRIDDELTKKNPDWVKLVMLKKQRLIIKDAIHRLRHRPKRLHFAN